MPVNKREESDLAMVAEQARDALAREQEFLSVRLKSSWVSLPSHGEIEPWSRSLQIIEAAGWTLTHWSTSTDGSGNIGAYPVFRRRGSGGLDPTSHEH